MDPRTVDALATRVTRVAPDSVAALRGQVRARAQSTAASLRALEAGWDAATDWRGHLKNHPWLVGVAALGLGIAAARVGLGAFSGGRRHGRSPRLLGSLLAMSAGALVRRWAAGRPTPRSLPEAPRRRDL
jgi:hypothetical protein